jgi:chemotaxis protein CheX
VKTRDAADEHSIVSGPDIKPLPTSAFRYQEEIRSIAPRSDWPVILRETALEVFSTMVGVALTVPEESNIPVMTHVTGMVGIAGPLSAILTLRCRGAAAIKLASQMLGVSLEDAAAQKFDAVGEICNIVAGLFKAKIGLGDSCGLSVPTVIVGKDYKIRAAGNDERLELQLLYERDPIWIALDIRP